MKTKWPDEFIVFMGLDCSTKAIHSVLLDVDENIKVQHKWAKVIIDGYLKSHKH